MINIKHPDVVMVNEFLDGIEESLTFIANAPSTWKLGRHWVNPTLLERALTHSSSSHERGVASNEVFEFLGDSVIDLLVAERLMGLHPDWSEGQLAEERSRWVSGAALGTKARLGHIGNMLRVGRGAERQGLREREGPLADAVEAICGAAYLDGGLVGAAEVADHLELLPRLTEDK